MTCQISCVILSYCYKYIGSSSLRTAVILIGVDKMNTVDIIIIVVIAAVFVGAAAHCGLTERETVRSVPETARGVREAATETKRLQRLKTRTITPILRLLKSAE